MIEALKQLKAKIAIPMHVFTEETLARFLARAAERGFGVRHALEPRIVVTRSDLPEPRKSSCCRGDKVHFKYLILSSMWSLLRFARNDIKRNGKAGGCRRNQNRELKKIAQAARSASRYRATRKSGWRADRAAGTAHELPIGISPNCVSARSRGWSSLRWTGKIGGTGNRSAEAWRNRGGRDEAHAGAEETVGGGKHDDAAAIAGRHRRVRDDRQGRRSLSRSRD